MSLFTHLRTKLPSSLRSNPIPEILEAIPDKISVLDATLVDKIISIIANRTNIVVNNNCVNTILGSLNEKGLIYYHTVQTDIANNITLIRKK